MKDWLKKLFSESSEVSNMRVMCMMTCCTACGLALNHGDVGTISVLLGAAFGGKLSQKFVEVKNG